MFISEVIVIIAHVPMVPNFGPRVLVNSSSSFTTIGHKKLPRITLALQATSHVKMLDLRPRAEKPRKFGDPSCFLDDSHQEIQFASAHTQSLVDSSVKVPTMPSVGTGPSVRFSDTTQTIHLPPVDSELSELFITAHDFVAIRLGAKLDTRNVKTKFQDGIQRIDDAFEAVFKLDESSLQNPSGVESLSLWCNGVFNGRGLERYVSSKHRRERGEYAIGVRQLLLAQSKELHADALSQMYHEASFPAAAYARLMGAADAVAAARLRQEDRNDSDADAKAADLWMSGPEAAVPSASTPKRGPPARTPSGTRRDLLAKSSRSANLLRETSQRIEVVS